ncbi:uncharacterized protein BDV17DRAFT_278726 [Aspergillus undulatus]|uniref:uncharacterized protein n=1 Tax=Aspergillus undulatus TaxID=1810928 RepID=UPI003CCE1B9D
MLLECSQVTKPTLTSATLPPQTGKVIIIIIIIIITGSTSGLGFELTRVIYKAGATVHRHLPDNDRDRRPQPRRAKCASSASISPLHTIKPFVEALPAQESRLDLLINNTGVASLPLTTALFRILNRISAQTAQNPTSSLNTLRQSWCPPHNLLWNPPDRHRASFPNINLNYVLRKMGNWFLAARLAKQLGSQGAVSITQNPGKIYTSIFDNAPRPTVLLSWPVYYTPEQGINTTLWAGFSEGVTVAHGGRFVVLFGRWHPCPSKDLLEAIRDKEEGEAVLPEGCWTSGGAIVAAAPQGLQCRRP